MPTRSLPTKEDVIRHYMYLTEEVKSIEDKTRISVQDKNHAFDEIGKVVTDIWNRSGIPILDQKNLRTRIQRLVQSKEIEYMNKNAKKLALDEEYMRKTKAHYQQLFDVAYCQCFSSTTTLKKMKPGECTCPEAMKIPLQDYRFYFDQRTLRNDAISCYLDRTTSNEQKFQLELMQLRPS